jgi:predicted dehydrogenase
MLAKMRVGIVGLEHYHATGWVESVEHLADRLEIVALYDPNPRLGETLTPAHSDPHLSASLKPSYRSIPFETDLDALIRNHQLDIAVVTLPPVSAPDAIERLAKAGIHLLVDKPGARTAAEAERAFATARSADVKVAVGLTRRLGRGWQDARDIVTSGRLGRLFSTEAIFVTSSVRVRDPANQIFSREKHGGGILHWLGVHDLDLLLWLTGERVVELQAMTGIVNGESIDVEDTISLALRYASGAMGTVHYAYALPRMGGEGYVALRGSGGSLKVHPNGNVTWIGPGSTTDPVMEQEMTYTTRTFPGYGSAGVTILEDLLTAIAEDRDPQATGEHVTEALRIIDAAYEAARTGTRVRLAP